MRGEGWGISDRISEIRRRLGADGGIAERRRSRGTVTQRSQREEHRGHREELSRERRQRDSSLRDPTRHKAARKRKSGRSARNDGIGGAVGAAESVRNWERWVW